MHYTTSCNAQSIAPEDGRDQRPKHVELIGFINKPLLLRLVGVYIIYINDARSNKYQIYIPSLHYQCNVGSQTGIAISEEPAVTISYPADEGETFLHNTVAYRQTFVAAHLRKQYT